MILRYLVIRPSRSDQLRWSPTSGPHRSWELDVWIIPIPATGQQCPQKKDANRTLKSILKTPNTLRIRPPYKTWSGRTVCLSHLTVIAKNKWVWLWCSMHARTVRQTSFFHIPYPTLGRGGPASFQSSAQLSHVVTEVFRDCANLWYNTIDKHLIHVWGGREQAWATGFPRLWLCVDKSTLPVWFRLQQTQRKRLDEQSWRMLEVSYWAPSCQSWSSCGVVWVIQTCPSCSCSLFQKLLLFFTNNDTHLFLYTRWNSTAGPRLRSLPGSRQRRAKCRSGPVRLQERQLQHRLLPLATGYVPRKRQLLQLMIKEWDRTGHAPFFEGRMENGGLIHQGQNFCRPVLHQKQSISEGKLTGSKMF